jgi:indolepyruvate ferredoxin oxidoreductase alpha subunit
MLTPTQKNDVYDRIAKEISVAKAEHETKGFTIASDPPGHVEVLLGNHAIARGIVEAGVQVASAYPGTPSSEILESLAKVAKKVGMYVQWSTNEKVAIEVAAAASMAGLRAAAVMKAQGLNVALDFVLHLNLFGTGNGGLLIVVCDDPGALSSVNEQDSRWLVRMGDYPLLEPSSAQEAKDMARWAFELSERLHSAVFLRSVTRVSHASSLVTMGDIQRLDRKASFDIERPFSPSPVAQKHGVLKEKMEKVRQIFESSPLNWYRGPKSPNLTLVVSGTGWPYSLDALEILGLEDSVGIIKLGTTWPLPIEFIWKHIQPDSPVLVVEEVDPFVEVNLKEELYDKWDGKKSPKIYGKKSGHMNAVGELSPDLIIEGIARILGIDYQSRDPAYDKKAREYAAEMTLARPAIYCPGCPHRASFWAIKQVIASGGKNGFVTGDIGCYAMDRYYGGQMVTRTQSAMGGGSGLASGFGKLGQFGFNQTVVAACGDSTFFHAVIPAMTNAVHHKADATFVLLDNGTTGMTGFQPNPGTLLDAMGEPAIPIDVQRLCSSLGCAVEVADPFDLEDTKQKLQDLLKLEGAKVLILRRECGLIAFRKEGPQYRVWVDKEKCNGCQYCTRFFKCPALIWDKLSGKAEVDEALCTGCGFCASVCHHDAIVVEKI